MIGFSYLEAYCSWFTADGEFDDCDLLCLFLPDADADNLVELFLYDLVVLVEVEAVGFWFCASDSDAFWVCIDLFPDISSTETLEEIVGLV